jgi:hypothetical protein
LSVCPVERFLTSTVLPLYRLSQMLQKDGEKSASFSPAGSRGSPVSMFLDRDDSKALIETLSKLGLDVTALRRAMVGRK